MGPASLVTRAGRFSLLALLVLAFVAPPSLAQKKKGDGMEEFDDACPYTKGDRELEKKLGYSKFGFLPWRGAEDSVSVQQNMGGIPMLWAETDHFRIGSSLASYKIPNNREERARIKAELGRLKKKLGRLNAPKKKLDPHLRLHLYAQRAEDAYAAFLEDWGLEEADFKERGPYLGHPNKILLLLCERKSEFGRYLRTYEDTEFEYSYRTGWHSDGLLIALNVEAIAENWREEKEAPVDSMFHCAMVANLGADFIDGWATPIFDAPEWMVYAYSHRAQRRIEPQWTIFDGRKIIYDKDDESWNWQPRVRNLVKNDFFASYEKMASWNEYSDMHNRDHLVSWSKLEYLLDEAEGDQKGFLTAATTKLGGRATKNLETPMVTRLVRALDTAYGLTPEELDAAWVKWVEKTYSKR
jgi:hypothetical protein